MIDSPGENLFWIKWKKHILEHPGGICIHFLKSVFKILILETVTFFTIGGTRSKQVWYHSRVHWQQNLLALFSYCIVLTLNWIGFRLCFRECEVNNTTKTLHCIYAYHHDLYFWWRKLGVKFPQQVGPISEC